MLTLAWKNIRFRKMRALLTIIGIGSSVVMVVLMSTVLSLTEKTLLRSFDAMAGQVRIQPRSDALNGNSLDGVATGSFLSQADISRIMATASGYTPEASSPVAYQVLVKTKSMNFPDTVRLEGVLPGHEAASLRGAEMASGAGRLAGAHDLILGDGAHSYLEQEAGHPLAVGDAVTLPGGAGEFVIKGIAAKRDAFTDVLAVVPLGTVQAAFRRGDAANYLVLSYPTDKAKAAAADLKAQLGDLDVLTAEAMLANADQALAQERSFFKLINGTVYATAVAILFMVMYMSVMERTKEIGTMRAVGAPRGAVVGGIVLEAAAFTLAGSLVAGVGAWVLLQTWEATRGVGSDFLFGLLRTMSISLAVSVLASLYPAYRAARVNPLEALRYE
jgi:putative ABC transport system permease protein